MAERVLGWGDDDVAAARERLGAVVAQLPETTAEIDEYGNTGFFDAREPVRVDPA